MFSVQMVSSVLNIFNEFVFLLCSAVVHAKTLKGKEGLPEISSLFKVLNASIELRHSEIAHSFLSARYSKASELGVGTCHLVVVLHTPRRRSVTRLTSLVCGVVCNVV